MKHLYILFNLLCLIILTACGGGAGGGASPTPPSNPISDNSNPSNPSSPSYSPTNSPSTPAPRIAPPPPRPNITATQFSVANTPRSTTGLPSTPSVQANDENTLKHIGVVDGGFAGLNKQYSSSSQVKFINSASNKGTHGTQVSNIIIGNANSSTHLYVAEAATDARGISLDFNYFSSIYNQGVRIFNNSFGAKEGPTPNLKHSNDGFYNGLGKYAENGAIFVFAAGNESYSFASDEASYPLLNNQAKKGWIAVTGLNSWNNLDTSYANRLGRAKNWGIAASGLERKGSLLPTDKGTSFAAPRVTAAVSKVWEQFPWMDNHLVTQTILSTADDYTNRKQPTQGPRDDVGWGILNVNRALKGPARFDKRLLLNGKEQVEVNFGYRNYLNKDKLTWSNDIAGDAGLKKEGTGLLYLSGENTYSGKTDINNGTLVLTGVGITQSPINIGSSGRLQANNTTSQTVAGKGLTNQGIFEVYGKGATIYGDYKGEGSAYLYINPEAMLEVRGTMDLGSGELIVHIPQITTIQSNTEKPIIQAKEIKNYNGKYYYSTESSNPYANIQQVKHSSQEIKVEYTRKPTAKVLEVAQHANTNTLNTAQILTLC